MSREGTRALPVLTLATVMYDRLGADPARALHRAGGMSTRPPRVSIIIPAYLGNARQAELLHETLETVDAQGFDDFETIIVDDGSPTPVGASVTSSRGQPIVLRQANGGSAMARNRGIAASRGDFLVFLDADDHLLPSALEAQLRAFERHPECGFVVGRREEMTYEGAPVPWGIAASPSTTQLYAILLGFDWYIIPPSSAMFRRAVLDGVGGFRDPWGADDLDFYLRVARSHEGFCHDHVVTRYRRYRASSSRDGQRMLASMRAVYAREWPHVAGDPIARGAFDRGLAQLTAIFRDCVVENFHDRLQSGDYRLAIRTAWFLAKEDPARFVREASALLEGALGAAARRLPGGDRGS